MAALITSDIQGVQHFNCLDRSGVGPRWRRWLRAFELFCAGKGVTNNDQKKALLLHSAGLEVQDIFFNLPEGEGDNVYERTRNALNNHFNPQSNVPFERHMFRSTAQSPDETIEQFVIKLRQKSETCEFGDVNAVNEQIRDQVIDKCVSHSLRRKLLEKGRELILDQLLNISRVFEDSERQAHLIEGKTVGTVNKLSDQKFKFKSGKPQRQALQKCYACGYEGHIKKDPKCPARDKQCRKCKNTGHFESCCQTRMNPGKNMSSSSSGQGAYEKQYQSRGKRNSQYKAGSLRYLDEGDSGYAFGVVHNLSDAEMIRVEIGGVCVDVMIDSGASCNVMNRETWEFMKKNKIQCVSENKYKPLFAYGSNKSLLVAGVFRATVKCCDKLVPDVEFVVIEGQGHALLGKRTAVELGILHIGPLSVNVVKERTMFEKYPECFRSIGKLNNYQLEIPIDNEVKPVVQKTRRIPFSLRDKLSQKLDELEADDIIEKVSGPTSWVSPVVVVPKRNDIRLCVDMRQANTAVRRKRHPIPTIEEMLCNMNQSKVISKLDIRAAYHQIELKPESRDITTFTTHKGLYRYKRLMFGVSCAPEMYQSIIQQIFQGCDGVTNMMDDILIHGSSEREHDERLEKAMQVVRERGLTLNPDKCCFKMSKVTFMGHVLSEHGIGQSDVKVKAVVDAREPKTSAEVRSFLGLVNYSARFIPDLATISAPLRVLTRKNEPFHWGSEQQDALIG